MLEELNKKVKYLNDERQKLMGKRDAAKEAFEKALKEYSEKYGLNLQESDLENELKRVELELQQQAQLLMQKIQEIEGKLQGNVQGVSTQQVYQVQQSQGVVTQQQGWGHVQGVGHVQGQVQANVGGAYGIFQSVDKTQDVPQTNQVGSHSLNWTMGTPSSDSGKSFSF